MIKMLSEPGYKPYNCSELEAAYGGLLCSFGNMYKMHSEVFVWLSSVFALLFSSFHTLPFFHLFSVPHSSPE